MAPTVGHVTSLLGLALLRPNSGKQPVCKMPVTASPIGAAWV